MTHREVPMIRGQQVQAWTDKGTPYTYWTRDVPPIPARFLESVVYLYPTREAAENGTQIGGSGFVTSMSLGDGLTETLYVVTVRHVAEKATVARLRTHDGETELFDTPEGGWHHHPDGDDVSVFPLVTGPARFSSIFPQAFICPEMAPVSGDDIFILGRFVGLDGRQRDAPVARFGHVAMQGTEKVWVSKRGVSQESFLVEALSLSGYSGSPVLVFWLQLDTRGGLNLSMGAPRRRIKAQRGTVGTPALLGIDWGHLDDKSKVRQPNGAFVSDDLYVSQNSGFAGVVPAWKIAEILEGRELEEMRKEQRAEMEKKPQNTTLDSADEVDADAEFARFEALTRKLVNVPKKELDEKRKDES